VKVDVVIKNGKVFTPLGLLDAGIAIEEEKIIAIAKDPHLPDADKTIDAQGNLVIPGGIDVHVHMEGGGEETLAAIAGGTTMIMTFAWVNGTLRKSFEDTKERCEKNSSIDFSLHAGIGGGVGEEVFDSYPSLVKEGISSIKHTMAAGGGFDSSSKGTENWFIVESFKRIKEANGIASTHAENKEIITYLEEKIKKAGRGDTLAQAESRPRISEDEAISRMIVFARDIGIPLHILHVASGNAANFIKRAKIDGLPVTGETCPHYLFFTQDDFEKFGPYIQFTPCLKFKSDRETLWKNLADGSMDIVATDHCNIPKSNKEKGWKDIWDGVLAGAPGVETRLMLMMSEGVNKGRISLERFVDACCTRPAKIFGMYPKKGAIQIGSDADIVIIDQRKELEIKADKLHQLCGYTPFEGWRIRGVPILTMAKGKVMMEEGKVWGEPGWGKFVPRKVPELSSDDIV